MAGTVTDNQEIGSEFHWEPLPKGEYLPWPERHVWYQTGRAALAAIWTQLPKRARAVLLVPDYFCAEVVDFWERNGIPIRLYRDNPLRSMPDWETMDVSPGDVVLAVNYFGCRVGGSWSDWRAAHDGVVLVEDHTHDPFSLWAMHSRADYAFASIRKTFQVPDGALVWSPARQALPVEPKEQELTGSSLKLAAMFFKADYLKGAASVPKEVFREMQMEGEASLGAGRSCTLSPWSKSLLRYGYPVAWRMRRRDNVRLLSSLVEGGDGVESLVAGTTAEGCPFNAIFLFPSPDSRERCRLRLIQNRIYPSIHWNANARFSAESAAIAGRILTIPVDQRYDETDMCYIASHLQDCA